jgi:hypothetical protein
VRVLVWHEGGHSDTLDRVQPDHFSSNRGLSYELGTTRTSKTGYPALRQSVLTTGNTSDDQKNRTTCIQVHLDVFVTVVLRFRVEDREEH